MPLDLATCLRPKWADPRVQGLMTTRLGCQSEGSYAAFNLGDAVGDAPAMVASHRAALAEACGAQPVFLRQVHGVEALRLTALDAARAAAGGEPPVADAALTTEPGVVCTVMVADCLPVLMAAPDGRGVAAAHAGWRGLAGGILPRTLLALCEAAACEPKEVQLWLGACIGAQAFEVGPDVRAAFAQGPHDLAQRFVSKNSDTEPGPKWWADLCGLARDQLSHAGATEVQGGTWCTVSDPTRFFSFRRDRITGRMAACVWIER